MKTPLRIAVALLVTLLLLSSCKHDPIVMPSPPAATNTGGSTGNTNGNSTGNSYYTCNPDTAYFQNDILPLFVSNCAKSGCHDAVSHREGKIYDSYANIMGTGDIRPFQLGGKTWNSITTSETDDRMPPQPNAALTPAQTQLIATWINQGAQNNVCNPGSCDTSQVTYAGTIVRLMQSHCTGCHGSVSPGGNINLTTYAGVQTVALNGRLFGSVNHDTGYSAMPKNTAKLPDCEIAQIRIWIQNGAMNN